MKRKIFVPEFVRPIRIPVNSNLKTAEPEIVFAGKKTSIKLTFQIPVNLNPFDPIKLQIFGGRNNKGEMLNIQTDDSKKDGFIYVLYRNIHLKVSQKNNPPGTITIFSPETGIKTGDCIFVFMKNVCPPSYRLLNKFFILYESNLTAPSGPQKPEKVWNEETQKNILATNLLHILGGNIHHLKIHAPSNVLPEKKFFIMIRPEDKFHNLSSEILNKKIEIFSGSVKLHGKIRSVKNSTCIMFETELKNQGVHRLEIKCGNRRFTSNPILCSDKEKFNLYWGMIHGHTEISDGYGTIDYYFHQLKNEARLDFGAPADHDHTWETTESMWKKTCKTVRKWNKPGSFVTFLGYEWAKWRKNGDGDRNIYYYYDDRPMYRSDNGHFPNPVSLFHALKKEKAIVIPHHTAHGGNFCDWKDHDPEKERLVEIYQFRGSYECPAEMGNPIPEFENRWEPFEKGYVINGLLSGWRVGFTGGGDDHISHAGTDFPQGNANYKDGLTGVFAKKLTRNDIWNALWNRRTIATTGARIFLYYSVNNKPLGSDINIKDAEKRNFQIIFHGTEMLDRIEIIRNGEIVKTIRKKCLDLSLDWYDSAPVKSILLKPTVHSKQPFAFYYIRAIQTDKEVAWASPVWIIGKTS